jgi:hypothetical protein
METVVSDGESRHDWIGGKPGYVAPEGIIMQKFPPICTVGVRLEPLDCTVMTNMAASKASGASPEADAAAPMIAII